MREKTKPAGSFPVRTEDIEADGRHKKNPEKQGLTGPTISGCVKHTDRPAMAVDRCVSHTLQILPHAEREVYHVRPLPLDRCAKEFKPFAW